jgi:hypothetical protein
MLLKERVIKVLVNGRAYYESKSNEDYVRG